MGERAGGWRIVVDRDLCQGHAVCQSEAPDVFEVSKTGELTVLDERRPTTPAPPPRPRCRYCPTHALSIDEEETDR